MSELMNEQTNQENSTAHALNHIGAVTKENASEVLQQAVAHYQAGQASHAQAYCQHIVAAQPQHADTLSFMGVMAHQSGDLDAAVNFFQQAIAAEPTKSALFCNLGVVLKTQGKLSEAIQQYQQALLLQPDYVEVHANLAAVFLLQVNMSAAEKSLQEVLRYQPDYAFAHAKLGFIFHLRGQLAEAIAYYQRAILSNPDYAEVHSYLGSAQYSQGKLDEAAESFNRVIALSPHYADSFSQLGDVYFAQAKLDEAVACYQKAVAINPDLLVAHCNIGVVHLTQGQPEKSLEHYRHALARNPDYVEAYSNILFAMQYIHGCSPEEVFAEHKKFAAYFEAPLKPSWGAHSNTKDKNKRLKIGYVSADFHDHAVALFIGPILMNHQKNNVEVFCYYNNRVQDVITEKLKTYADHWRACRQLTDDQLAELIRADGIDILVDLSGHTSGHRLLTFARKPAPVQVTWIGYPGTTGLTAIDYRLTDANLDPLGSTDKFHSEKLIRLLQSAVFQPAQSPDINLLPALASQTPAFTLACLNSLAKINQAVVGVWADILRALPHAKLMLGNAGEPDTQQRLLAMFSQANISADRLILKPRMTLGGFLALHGEIDLALDPFPYGGGTTTNHSLWMGVPVITLVKKAGCSTAGRQGAAVLNSASIPEFIAPSEAAYVALAVEYANDLPRLNAVRQSLRSKISAHSAITPARLTQNLELAYRFMWKQWCEEKTS